MGLIIGENMTTGVSNTHHALVGGSENCMRRKVLSSIRRPEVYREGATMQERRRTENPGHWRPERVLLCLVMFLYNTVRILDQ